MSGIEQDAWKMDQVYSEGLVHRIIWAAQDVTGATIEDLMVSDSVHTRNIENIFQSSVGSGFYEFLGKYEFNKVTIYTISIRYSYVR